MSKERTDEKLRVKSREESGEKREERRKERRREDTRPNAHRFAAARQQRSASVLLTTCEMHAHSTANPYQTDTLFVPLIPSLKTNTRSRGSYVTTSGTRSCLVRNAEANNLCGRTGLGKFYDRCNTFMQHSHGTLSCNTFIPRSCHTLSFLSRVSPSFRVVKPAAL